jgi:hypothetical protein
MWPKGNSAGEFPDGETIERENSRWPAGSRSRGNGNRLVEDVNLKVSRSLDKGLFAKLANRRIGGQPARRVGVVRQDMQLNQGGATRLTCAGHTGPHYVASLQFDRTELPIAPGASGDAPGNHASPTRL